GLLLDHLRRWTWLARTRGAHERDEGRDLDRALALERTPGRRDRAGLPRLDLAGGPGLAGAGSRGSRRNRGDASSGLEVGRRRLQLDRGRARVRRQRGDLL